MALNMDNKLTPWREVESPRFRHIHTSQEALITQGARCVLLPLLQTPNPDSLNLKPTLLRLILKSLKLKAASELNRS